MIRRIWHPPAPDNRLGRRGRCLLAFAAFDLGYAWLMFTASPTTLRSSSVFRWFSSIAPITAWAMLWGVVGMVCLYHAFHHYDRFGFIAAIGIKMLWGLLSAAGALIDNIPPLYVAFWPTVAYLVWTIAGWSEPDAAGKDRS